MWGVDRAGSGLEAAILRHLVGGAPAPLELAGLPQTELALLRALCRSSPNRGAVAADGLARLIEAYSGRASSGGRGPGGRQPPGYADLLNAEVGAAGQAGVQGVDGTVPGAPLTPGYPDLLNAEVGAAGSVGPAVGPVGPVGQVGGPRVVSAFHEELGEIRGSVLAVQALEEELAAFAPLLGMGWHKAGTALVSVVCDRLGDLRSVLMRAPELRRLAELLGRQRHGLAKGVGAERGGRVTAVGVKVGGGLEDALASELALLADPATEDLFLTRLLERRLVSLEMTSDDEGEPAKPRRRRGPAIVLVDTSGSMLVTGPGMPTSTGELAKAVALAVVERLTAERRPVEVALFGGEGAMRVTRFAERQTSPGSLFDFLMTSFHGGTDFDGPLVWALDRIGPRERRPVAMREADLLLITDGRARLKKATKERLVAARRAGLQLFVAYVDQGLGYDPRGFTELADQVAVASPRGLTLLPPQAPKAR